MIRPSMLSLVFAAILAAIACSGAEAEAHRACHSITDAVEQRLEATHAASASVAVVRHGRIIFEQGFGTRSLGGLPVNTDTRFEIGSTTKQFTAAAILQLRHAARISLSDKVGKFLPNFPHASDLTIINLLQQTSGLGDYPTASVFIPLTYKRAGGIRAIKSMARVPLLFKPGSQWKYSTFNYIILGRIIEIVSGESYPLYLKHHLFDPAGMSHTTTVSDEAQIDKHG